MRIKFVLPIALVAAILQAATAIPSPPASAITPATSTTPTPAAPSPTPAASARAATYYVDCRAKRAGTGSAASPWNALAQVTAHGAFVPGDRILLKRGTTCVGRVVTSGSGLKGRPIVLGAYGSGAAPTVEGRGTPNLTGAVELTNQQWWTVQDLHITNTTGVTSTRIYRAGVMVRSRHGGPMPGVVLQRLFVERVASSPIDTSVSSRQWGGITVASVGGAGDSFPGLLIKDNRILRVGRSGISVMNDARPSTYDTGVRITGNRVSWSRGDGIVVFGLQRSRIDHNVVDHGNDEWPCPLCGPLSAATANAGIWPAFSSDIQIDHNEVYGMKEPGGDGESFDVDQGSQRILFEYNYSHDNEGGGILFCGSKDVTVRFNIFQNNRRATFNFIANVPSYGTLIHNNTVSNGNLPQTKVIRTFNVDRPMGKPGRVTFVNNIVYNGARYSGGWWQWPSADVVTRANTIIGIHGRGRPNDRLTSRRDPGLRAPGTGGTGFGSLAGYSPAAGVAVLRGVPISADVTRDFFGRRIDPRRPPRGAAG